MIVRGAAKQRLLDAIERNKYAPQAELAAECGVTPAYAGRLRNEYLQLRREGLPRDWLRSAESWRRGVRRALLQHGLGLCHAKGHDGSPVVPLERMYTQTRCRACEGRYQREYVRPRSGRPRKALSARSRSIAARLFRRAGWQWLWTQAGGVAVAPPGQTPPLAFVAADTQGSKALRKRGHMVFIDSVDGDIAVWVRKVLGHE